jgi:hypothetical protein
MCGIQVPKSFDRPGLALIGNAVHAMSPSPAQGASLTLETAEVGLACLKSSSNPTIVFGAGPCLCIVDQRVEQVTHGHRR